MAVSTGFKATMMKAPIHAPGDGFQLMKLLVWCSFGTNETARADQVIKNAPVFTRAFFIKIFLASKSFQQ
jgi:hypothetical protein